MFKPTAANYLNCSLKSNIQVILMNSKPVNALTIPLLQELKVELQRIHASSDIKGVVFGSLLPKVLSAGLDLKTLVAHEEFSLPGDGTFASKQEMAAYRDHIRSYMGLFGNVVEMMITLPQATVAMVKGHSPAGGTVLSLCADSRIGSDAGFTMGLNEVQVLLIL